VIVLRCRCQAIHGLVECADTVDVAQCLESETVQQFLDDLWGFRVTVSDNLVELPAKGGQLLDVPFQTLSVESLRMQLDSGLPDDLPCPLLC
jgi:hypothetical protein